MIIISKVGATYKGAGAEVSTTGDFVVGTAKTSTVGKDDLLKQLIQPNAPGGTTPENSALYSPDDIAAIVFVREQTATGSLGTIFPGS